MRKNNKIVLMAPAGFGGIQSWCINYGNYLNKIGYSVTILWEQDRANIKRCPTTNSRIENVNILGGRFVNQRWLTNNINQYFKNASVVYPNTSSIAYRALDKLRNKKPTVIAVCHSIDEHDLNTITGFESICDKIVVLGDTMNSLLQSYCSNSIEEKVNIIRHGTKPKKSFYPKPKLPPLKLLFVGRLDENKQPHIAIEIVKSLEAVSIPTELIIAGDGDLKEKIKKTVRNIGLTDNVKMVGNVSSEYVNELYSNSHFTLLLSKSEGFGLVALEAMANGSVPIVTSNSGVSEIIISGKTGFVIDKPIVDEAINCIKRSIKCSYSLISHEAFISVTNNHDQFKSFEKHEKLLHNISPQKKQNTQNKSQIKIGLLDHILVPNNLTYYLRKFNEKR